ncbi:delta-6 fatty acid desaturase [Spinellus fusiger]|nr:delta-6 fatty acid desaturase [Spinellus fusiger]
MPIFTREQLDKTCKEAKDGVEDAKKYVIIDKKVYDVTEFINEHPGGDRVLLTHIGKDATDVFHAMHPPSAYETLANYYTGDFEAEPTSTSDKSQQSIKFAREMRELREKLQREGYFDASIPFYIWKVLSTVSICAVSMTLLSLYGETSTLAVIVSAIILGIFWQQCGWLAHDFGHHQVSKDRIINDMLLVFLGNMCQGFSLSWWKNKHNTHHASTNVSGHDPDIDTAPILLWDEFASANYYGSLKDTPGPITRFLAENVLPYQTRYYVFILAFARISWALQSLSYSLKAGAINKSATLNFFERSSIFIHWGFFSYAAWAWTGNFRNLVLFFVISQAVTGYALAFVFALNHAGMPVITQEKAETMEFFEIQTITGRDVALGVFGDWFFGGLNYQIEHHIFPDMPRHSLKKVKPMVRALCKKYNILHHNTSAVKGTIEVLETLDMVQKLSLKLSKKAF